MEHWFDRLARDAAAGRLSRRQVLAHGARTVAGGMLLGATWSAVSAPAAGGAPCGLGEAPECEAIAREATRLTRAACLAESTEPAKINCLNSVVTPQFNRELSKCLVAKDAFKNCERCEACGPEVCVPKCVLTACTRCDPSTGACIDTCPEGQYCSATQGGADENGGVCVPMCPQPCAPYDPATKRCKDTCQQTNPCTICRQGLCQSTCPDPEYCQPNGKCGPCNASRCQHLEGSKCIACDPTCEKCENGTCVSTCPGVGAVCCLGQCQDCCGGVCDRSTGLCGGGCPSGQSCCPTGPSSFICQDLTTDPRNCGSCGNICSGNASKCNNGTCAFCPTGSPDCQGPGAPGGRQCCNPGDVCCQGYCCPSGYHCCPGSLEACCPPGKGCCKPPILNCGC